MIKLGKLTETAMNRQFPDNWKSLAIMMNIPFTMYDDDENSLPEDTSIDIEFNENVTLTIKADNSIKTTAPVNNEMIAQMIVDFAQQSSK